jgi:hypothetical protein
MKNNITNNMVGYKDQFYRNNPVGFYDYINDKYTIIHKRLYKNALHKLLVDLAKDDNVNDADDINKWIDDFYKTHKIIEILPEEYYSPSDIIIYNKKFPYNSTKYNLSKYWENYQYLKQDKDINDLLLDEDTLKYAEIIYIDYINSKCKFKSKLTGEEFWVDFNYINNNTKLSQNMKLDNTFTHLLNELYK